MGKKIIEGKTDFKKLEKHALELPEIENKSAQLEIVKATLNQYILNFSVDSK